MPFIPNTPESLIGRSDSKNPETTCRGITGGGRPCRRPLGGSPGASPNLAPVRPRPKPHKLRADDPRNPDLYCWQHRDQASASSHSSPGPKTNTTPILEGRESFDSLIDRLGIVEAEKRRKRPGHERHNEKITQTSHMHVSQPPQTEPKTKRVSFCCCFTVPVVEEEPPARPNPNPIQSDPAKPATSKLPSSQHLAPPSAGPRPSLAASKPSSAKSNVSQTSQYLSLIPPTASPQTASLLMAELAKPISQQDEAGYIYIFWLTPESQPAEPPAEAARDLLAPPTRPEGRQRRPSDVLESFAANKGTKSDSSKKTVLLKIGRASNVQRRLNEWSRQCGYNLSLIRYYPYISSSQPSTPRKMPHSHKVERLIHLELAGAGLRVGDKGACDACGKSHKEWFEVDANRKGIAMVDEVVKRWSDWDEGRG